MVQTQTKNQIIKTMNDINLDKSSKYEEWFETFLVLPRF